MGQTIPFSENVDQCESTIVRRVERRYNDLGKSLLSLSDAYFKASFVQKLLSLLYFFFFQNCAKQLIEIEHYGVHRDICLPDWLICLG